MLATPFQMDQDRGARPALRNRDRLDTGQEFHQCDVKVPASGAGADAYQRQLIKYTVRVLHGDAHQ